MPYADSLEWVPVCQNCPLKKCVEGTPALDTCPIRIAHEKHIAPIQMVKIEREAGEQQPVKFRKLIYEDGTGNMLPDDRFLWYDNEGALEQRLQRAVAAYQYKRRQQPNMCELLPEAINGDKVIAGLTLRPKSNALKNHYWLWREGETA